MTRETRRTACFLLGALALGVAARVFGAWALRHATSADYGLAAILSKHIAEGRDFPTFYYGQSYMGSLEPAFGGLLGWLFGPSPFVICLGTALIAALILPLAFTWGRAAAGGRATGGAAAALLCAIGPSIYFDFMASPHGGYALTLVLNTLIVWLAVRIGLMERSQRPPGMAPYAILGLAGGIAWWTNQLVTPGLATAAITLAAALRLRVFRARAFAAAGAFALGSLPWWLWNARNGWDSLSFRDAMGETRLLEGLKLFFWDSFAKLNDLPNVPGWWDAIGLAALLAATAPALAVSLARLVRRRASAADAYVLAAGLLIAVSAALAAPSRFVQIAHPRYLLPLWPALAVLAGATGIALGRRWAAPLAWAPAALVLVWQTPNVPRELRRVPEFDAGWRAAAELSAGARQRGISALYGDYGLSWVNFASGEGIPFCGVDVERYAPYDRAAATGACYAFVQNCGGIRSFLADSGGSARTDHVSWFRLDYDLRPPPPLRPIPSDALAEASDDRGHSLLPLFRSRNIDDGWRMDRRIDRSGRSITLVLREPMPLAGIRIWSGNGGYPAAVAIQGRTPQSDRWEPLGTAMTNTRYFWSGPRVYWAGLFYRLELRFPERALTAVRILFAPHDRVQLTDISLVELMAAAPPATAEPEALAELLEQLARRGTRRLYADRWVCEQVHVRTGGRIEAPVDPRFTRKVDELPTGRDPEYPPVRLTPLTALLARAEDAEMCRSLLADRRIRMSETRVGPWALFDFGPGDWRFRYAGPTALYWVGPTALGSDRRLVAKRRAWETFREAARIATTNPPASEAIALCRSALDEYPGLEPAAAELERRLRADGRSGEADSAAQRRLALTRPDVAAPARFPHGVQLLGIRPARAEAPAGGTFEVRYYWRIPSNAPRNQIGVFAHFQGGARFQDDRVLLSDTPEADITFQPFPEVFVEDRTVIVPAGTPPGEYRLGLGLIDRRTDKRWPVRTDLPSKKGMIHTPFRVTVR